MNLRHRTLITLGTTSFGLVILLYFVLALFIGRKFAEVEEAQALDVGTRVRASLVAQTDSLCGKAADWANWDDTWNFIQDRNQEYVESNLATPAWEAINLDFILIFDEAGQRMATTARTPKGTGKAPSSMLDEHFRPSSPTIAGLVVGDTRAGYLFTKGLPPIEFCTRPVVHTDGTGPVMGTLVMGRYLDAARLAALAQKTRVDLFAASPVDPSWDPTLGTVAARLAEGSAIDVEAVSSDRMLAWVRLSEFGSGRPLVARATLSRPVHAQAAQSMKYSLGALVAFGLLFVGAIMGMVDRFVLPTLRGKLAEIQTNTQDLSATASQSAATAASEASMVAQVSTTIEEIRETSRASASNAREALAAATEALRINQEAQISMGEAMQVMQVIEQVATIVDSVNELQEQSNLLAVNAGIVAAKAGEQGRGFAVVATELRDLAERSKGATRRIREAILRSDDGRRAIEQADGVIRELGRVLEEATSQIREIVAATQLQAAGVQQINDAMTAVAQGGRETSAGSRQIEQAVVTLEQLGTELTRFVGKRTVAAESPQAAPERNDADEEESEDGIENENDSQDDDEEEQA